MTIAIPTFASNDTDGDHHEPTPGKIRTPPTVTVEATLVVGHVVPKTIDFAILVVVVRLWDFWVFVGVETGPKIVVVVVLETIAKPGNYWPMSLGEVS